VIDGILKFPSNSPSQVNTRKLVQMRLDDEFIKAIDIWRTAQPDMPARTKAIERLAAIGLADQMLKAARRQKRQSPVAAETV
jgi:hypothetical protein